jgi:hypothetical protein
MQEIAKAETEFLDRVAERAFLLDMLPPRAQSPSIGVIRGPTGYGKSLLTTWLAAALAEKGVATCIVDPQVRAPVEHSQVYQGRYLQACIEALERARLMGVASFESYIRERGLKNLGEYRPGKHLRAMPGWSTVYSIGIDLLDRVLVRGEFAPAALLKSDDAVVTALCAAYLRAITATPVMVLIIRETQLCDAMSLRELLRAHREAKGLFLLFEYTTDDRSLRVEHQKLFEAEVAADQKVRILDLERLPWNEVQSLLERYARDSGLIEGEFQAKWDGNLRAVKELRYRVALGQSGTAADLALPAPTNLLANLQVGIGGLGRTQRFLLATLAEHIEPIPQAVFRAMAASVPTAFGLSSNVDDMVATLAEQDRFVGLRGSDIGIANDDIARAIVSMPDHLRYQLVARQTVLDYYAGILRARDFSGASLVTAARHAIRLASSQADLPMLTALLELIENEINASTDPAIYVDLVVRCANEAVGIGANERARLLAWAAKFAYRSSDFTRVVTILDAPGSAMAPADVLLLAHSLIEVAREDDARRLARDIKARTDIPQSELVGELILGNLDLVTMDLEGCLRRLERVVEQADAIGSALAGHALRLMESAVGEREAVEYCDASIERFERLGLPIAAAYSRLAVTRHLARLGKWQQAIKRLDEAQPALTGIVASRHFLLNNRAGVELLSPKPDFKLAQQMLRQALTVSRDKFSDMTILQNLLIAAWQAEDDELAQDAAGQLTRRLDQVDATAVLMAEGSCFALAGYFEARGDITARDRVRQKARSMMGTLSSSYWAWRFGEMADRPPRYPSQIMDKPYHPSFLSQWQLDQEVVDWLMRQPQPALERTTSPVE